MLDEHILSKLKAELKGDIMKEVNPVLQDLGKNMLEIKHTLTPIAEVFESTAGFAKITVALMKFFALLGAGIGVIVAVIKWLKT